MPPLVSLVFLLRLYIITANIMFYYGKFLRQNGGENGGYIVTVQPWHLLVSIFMKTRSLVVPPYADLDEKVLMQASLQHTFSFKPAHGWTVHENKKLKRVLTNEIKKSIVIKVVRTTDRKAGISASPWHESVTRVHISDTVANKKRNVSVLLLRL